MTTARGRAIIADDEPEILELLQEVLAGQGYEMMTATEGAEALAVVPQRFQRVEREREGRHGPDVEYRRPSQRPVRARARSCSGELRAERLPVPQRLAFHEPDVVAVAVKIERRGVGQHHPDLNRSVDRFGAERTRSITIADTGRYRDGHLARQLATLELCPSEGAQALGHVSEPAETERPRQARGLGAIGDDRAARTPAGSGRDRALSVASGRRWRRS